jgi:outer membrane lipoprotein-sorting protein
MMKRLAPALIALGLATAAPAAADRLTLPAVSQYLETIGAAEANFTQINSDGSRMTGRLFIKRPGRIRFEYDAPQEDTLVMASGGQIAVFDGRGTPEQYPLRRTPLGIILDRDIDLTRERMVTGHGEQDGRTIVQAQDPDHPEYGRIYLYFETNPTRLAEWMIISESGEQTRTLLSDLAPRDDLSERLFSIQNEISGQK